MARRLGFHALDRRLSQERRLVARRGDRVCRWEYPRIDDYRSWGCINLSPGDLRELASAWRRYFDLGADSRGKVHVKR